MLSMTINSISESAKSFTLNILDNINARSTATFTVITDNTITVGQEVLIYDGATLIFGGTIDTFDKSFLQGKGTTGRRQYNIKCIDFNQITDRRRVYVTYENKTISYIVNDIVTTFLTNENITVGTITKGTDVISQAVFNYVTASQAFDFIRDASGGDLNWNIDYSKELTFFQRSDNNGTSFTDANCKRMSLKETRQEYRNSQLVRAGDSTTETQVKETATPKPDGESRSFSLRFPLAKKPTIYVDDVAITDSDVGINGLDKNKKWYWQKNNNQISQDTTETVLSTETLTISYQGLKPILVQSDNYSGQNERSAIEGGTGIYQQMSDKKDIEDKDTAIEYANGLLVKYGTIPRTISIEADTIRSAGQLIQVQSDNLDINEDFLITSVAIKDFDGSGTLTYSINGSSGEDLGTWVEFFRSLSEKEVVSIRENEVLILLQTVQEYYGYSGKTTLEIFSPPYCSETLICAETLICGNALIDEVIVND